jgi:phosphate transport system substrate-binding protein
MKNLVSTFALALALALLPAPPAAAQTEAAARPYQPRPVQLPKDAPYVLADGSIYIVGNDGMKEMLEKFNELFTKTHGGFKFTMLLEGSSTGIGGLTANVSAFAPMGREAWPTDLSGFHEFFGYEPLDIRIGYDGFGPRPKLKTPPAIYVNVKNPLAGLTVAQVTRIFTTGAKDGDITQWSQLGLKGEWAKRAIHPYGPRDDGGLATSTRYTKMDKLPFTRRYEPLPKGVDIINAVAADPYGIAFAPFIDAAAVSRDVKVVPLAVQEGGPFADASYENVAAGRYPYSPHLHIYLNRAPGKPLDPFVKEYLRLVLSQEGQAIIAAQKDSDEGFVPLSARDLATELAKIE